MRLYITDISDITEDMFNTGKMLVPEYRQEKIDRYQYMEDKRRSLVAGLLLNYATKDYEAGNYIAHNYITGNCVDKNYLIEASKRERENIHAGHLWESNSEYDIDINKLISLNASNSSLASMPVQYLTLNNILWHILLKTAFLINTLTVCAITTVT